MEHRVTHKSRSVRIAVDLSTETWRTRRTWKDSFKFWKTYNCQPKLLYPAKLSQLMENSKYSMIKGSQRNSIHPLWSRASFFVCLFVFVCLFSSFSFWDKELIFNEKKNTGYFPSRGCYYKVFSGREKYWVDQIMVNLNCL